MAGFNFQKIAKDLVVTALLATAIFGSTIAFKTKTAPGGLVLDLRFDIAFYIIAAVVVGRLLLWLTFWRKAPNKASGDILPKGWRTLYAALLAKIAKRFAPTLLVFAIVFPFLPFTDRYLLDLGVLVLTYVMLGWGLNIVVGLAGLLDLGYVAFYAIGAYSYALLAHYFGFSFWMCLPLAGILAAFWGLILGFPVLRLRGDYLAIVTLAFGEIIRIVLLNWYQFTGGPDGLSGIPRPSFFGLEFKRGEGNFADFFGLEYSTIHRIVFLYFLILALALLTNFITNRLRRLPIGRAWEALREDEIACRSLGLNTTVVKLTAFSIGAMFAGFAGSFFATRQGFISPESFTFIESALILAIVVLGGMGSQIGVVIASIAMIGGFEIFREAEEYRMLIFGLAMVTIMIWRPRGLISKRIPSIFLKKKKAVSGDLVAQGEGH
ncbi:MAG: branched-chain amino acid ABC transporter permease [Sneathiella sp.]|nr:MAG: branched-chain amino acid ABC transporter permease [Sneathiella sp.]